MSNLHKFHRRTQSVGPATWPAMAIGMGDNAHGYWLGGESYNKLIVAPKSTETVKTWGSYGDYRYTSNFDNGLPNTNTLAGYGQTAHPAAYYCKNLSTGGYNTWYLPAVNELMTMYNNRAAIPFATANWFTNITFWSSTERDGRVARTLKFNDITSGAAYGKQSGQYIRAVRRSAI